MVLLGTPGRQIEVKADTTCRLYNWKHRILDPCTCKRGRALRIQIQNEIRYSNREILKPRRKNNEITIVQKPNRVLLGQNGNF